MYAFKCENDNKNKLKCICRSQLTNNKFEEYRNCLDGCDYERL